MKTSDKSSSPSQKEINIYLFLIVIIFLFAYIFSHVFLSEECVFKSAVYIQMIRNLTEKNILRRTKEKLFSFFILNKAERTHNSFLFAFFIICAQTFFQSAIFFKDPLFASYPALQKITLVLGQNWHMLLGIEQQTIDIIVVGIYSMGIFLIIIGFYTERRAVLRVTTFFYSLLIVLIVPVTTMTANNLELVFLMLRDGQTLGLFWSIKLIGLVLSYICLFYLHLFFFYDFNPLRRQNKFWKLSNKFNFFRLMLGTTRASILTWGRISILPLLMSLFFEIRIISLEKQNANHSHFERGQALMKIPRHFIIGLHLVIICHQLTKSSEISLKLLFLAIVLTLMESLTSFIFLSKKAQTLPSCQQQNSTRVYSFYFNFIKSTKGVVGQQILSSILASHSLICSSYTYYNESHSNNNIKLKCIQSQCFYFSQGQSQNSRTFANKLSKLLKKYRYCSPYNEILHQLWQYELYHKITLQTTSRRFSSEYEYIIYMLSKNKSRFIRDDEQQQNSNNRKKAESIRKEIFLFFGEVVSSFVNMYEQLKKSRPQISILIENIQKACFLVKKINQAYEAMYLIKKLDFTLIELYFSFEEVFPVKQKSTRQLKQKLSKTQIYQQFDDIKQAKLPCIEINERTGKIENFNKEAIKLFRFRNFQLQNKKLDQLFEPSFSLENLCLRQSVTNSQQSNLQVFARTHSHYSIVYLRGIKKHLSKPTVRLILEQVPINPSEIHILVDSSFRFILSSKPTISLSETWSELKLQMNSINKQQVDIRDIYEHALLPIAKSMINSNKKIINQNTKYKQSYLGIQMKQNSIIKGDIRHLSVRIMHIESFCEKEEINRKRFTLQASQNTWFLFNYTQDENNRDNLIIQGQIDSPTRVKQELFIPFQTQKQCRKLQPLNCDSVKKQFGQEIKSYRLYKKQLFNIDLEDKLAYEKQFDENSTTFTDQFYIDKGALTVLKFLILVILLFILSEIIIADKLFFTRLAMIPKLNDSVGRMQKFSLQASRLNSLFRDRSNRLFDKFGVDFQKQIIDSMKLIQTYSSEIVFDPRASYQVSYKEKMLQGNLNELYQYAFNEIYSLIQSYENKSMIESVHDLNLLQLGRLAKQERRLKHDSIEIVINQANVVLNCCAYSFILLLALVLLILHYVRQIYNLKFALKIHPLLLLSEAMTSKLLEEVINFKQYLSSHEKGKTIQEWQKISKPLHKHRRKPKHILTGIRANLFNVGLGVMAILFAYTCVIIGLKILKINTDNIIEMVAQEEAIIGSYIFLSDWAFIFINLLIERNIFFNNEIEHSGILPAADFQQLEEKITFLENQKYRLHFSSSLTSDIQSALYHNSCSYAVQRNFLLSEESCSRSQPGFYVENPFELKLIFFLRDQHYNLLYNLTETFGATGIFSQPLSDVFRQLGQRCYKETSELALKFTQILNILNIMMSTFCVLLSLAFVGIFVMFRRTGLQLEKCCYELNWQKIFQ